MNLFRTISTFYRNPFINPYYATLRHIGWQFRKAFNVFPFDLSFPNFNIRIVDRSIANGPGALLNAMGYYDPNNMFFLQELFKKRLFASFFDIGANIGIYSLIAASTGNASVVAFEPHPRTFSFLQQNISLNSFEGRIKGIQAALGEKDGAAFFTDEAGSAVNHVLSEQDKNIGHISVKLIRGDTFCREQNIVPDIVKIDVEGYETSVLRGFASRLKDLKVIFVECRSQKDSYNLLCKQFGFLGPYKIDYRSRQFTNEDLSYEDWVFINPTILGVLSMENFQFNTRD